MKLLVSVRVAGETKGRPTYHKLLDDLSRCGIKGEIVEGGFANYRLVPVSVGVPAHPAKEIVEAEGDSLIAQLHRGLGADPRMFSGRLTVVVDLSEPDRQPQEVLAELQVAGYTAELQK